MASVFARPLKARSLSNRASSARKSSFAFALNEVARKASSAASVEPHDANARIDTCSSAWESGQRCKASCARSKAATKFPVRCKRQAEDNAAASSSTESMDTEQLLRGVTAYIRPGGGVSRSLS